MHTIYHYHPDTGAFVDEGSPRFDPLYPETPLIPAFAVTQLPPEHRERQWPFWRNGQWCLLPDFRGVILYRIKDGSQASLDQPGITPDTAGLTELARPGPEYTWSNNAWVIDEAYFARQRRVAAERQFEACLDKAEKTLRETGLLDPAQEDPFLTKARQAAWTAYLNAIINIRSSVSFPDIKWPEEPTQASIAELAATQRKSFEQERARQKAKVLAEEQRREQEKKEWEERERRIREDERKRRDHPDN